MNIVYERNPAAVFGANAKRARCVISNPSFPAGGVSVAMPACGGCEEAAE